MHIQNNQTGKRRAHTKNDGSNYGARMIKSSDCSRIPKTSHPRRRRPLRVQHSGNPSDDPVAMRLIELREEMSQSLAP